MLLQHQNLMKMSYLNNGNHKKINDYNIYYVSGY